MSSQMYALVTTQCNLSCPHCDIKDQNDNFNRDLFVKKICDFPGTIVLFGGEPSLYPDRLYDIYYHSDVTRKKIKTISTNLVYLDDRLVNLYCDIKYIASSWNPHRFTDLQYKTWLNHLSTLSEYDIEVAILITLTNDLFDMGVDSLFNIISTWNSNAIKYINFEPYVGESSDKAYFEKIDDFLCEIFNKWEFKFHLKNTKLAEEYYRDCSHIYSLYPDGTVINCCPHMGSKMMPSECYTCERSGICRPCQLQKVCSYPKKFTKLVSTSNILK